LPYVLIQHTVKDFARFKSVFDDEAERRRMNGSQGGRLFRSVTEPDEVVALFEWADNEGATKFTASYELREAVEWAGVKGEAKIMVLEEVEQADA
jgi:heme-degrading monooxygenase HmoA